jgi:hypothetical protein
MIFADGLACRLPVSLTNEETFQNKNSNFGFQEGEKY